MPTTILHKTIESDSVGPKMTFVWSTPRPDVYDDVVGDVTHPKLGWDTTDFDRNPVSLLNHVSRDIIGRWKNSRIENGALVGDLELAPAGTSAVVDEVRALVACGILKACSVGFIGLKSEPRGNGSSGRKYTRMRLVEVSLCAVPANADALLQAKKLGVSTSTIRRILKSQNNMSLADRITHARASVKRYSVEERKEIHRRAKAMLARNKSKSQQPTGKLLLPVSPEARLKAEKLAYNREVLRRAKAWQKTYQAAKAEAKKLDQWARSDPPAVKREPTYVVWRGMRIPISPTWGGEDV